MVYTLGMQKSQAETETVLALAEKAETSAREIRNSMMRYDYESAIALSRKLGAISNAISEIIDDSAMLYAEQGV